MKIYVPSTGRVFITQRTAVNKTNLEEDTYLWLGLSGNRRGVDTKAEDLSAEVRQRDEESQTEQGEVGLGVQGPK